VSVEDRLAALEVEWPETPDVAPRVRARLEARPRRRRWPRLAIPLAVVALVAAVPPARSTVLDWLGIGGETIQRVPQQPTPAPGSTPPDFGRRIPLPSDAPVPAALGRPDAVYEENEIVTLDYREPRAVLSYFPGRTNREFVRKFAGPDTTIDRVTVNGEPGFWVAGALHGVIYESPSGSVVEAPSRLAGNTLVWRRGDRTLRLEADISKERALEIARSIP
jgi:hypothetical protein